MSEITWYKTNMTSNTSPAPLKASANSEYSLSPGYQAYRAFNGKDEEGGEIDTWASESGKNINSYLILDFGELKSINKVKLKGRRASNVDQVPTDFRVEASDNSGTYEVVGEFKDLSWTGNEEKTLDIKEGNYSKLKIVNIKSANPSFCSWCEVTYGYQPSQKLIFKADNKFLSTLGDSLLQLPNDSKDMILKHGISVFAIDLQKELLNKVTVLSDGSLGLVEKIDPTNLMSQISEGGELILESEVPVSKIEVLFNVKPYSSYYLISEKPTIGIYNNTTQDVIVTTETEPFTLYDEFDDEVEVVYYTDDPEANAAKIGITHNWSPLDDLEGPKSLAVLTQEEDAARDVKVTGLMKEEFVHLSFWINIENLIGIQSTTVSENAPFVIQRKSDKKYFSYHQGYFFEIPLNERMVHNYGFLPTKINAITKNEWRKFLGDEKEIRLCYLFSNQKLATKAVMKSIETTHRVGIIKVLREIRSTTPSVTKVSATVEKFSLEGRLKEIERINLNNLLELQAHTALAFEADKLEMHELVVETFDDSDYEVPVVRPEKYYTTNMTSNTTPSPLKASASSIFGNNPSLDAYKSFDGKNADQFCWVSYDNQFTNSWVQIDYGEQRKVDLLKLTARNLTGNESTFVKSFIVSASDDGLNFIEVGRFENISDLSPNETRVFELKESTKRIYRITVLEKQGTMYNHVSMGEVLFGLSKGFEGTNYNEATGQFEGEFTLEIPLEVPDYATQLFIHSEGKHQLLSIIDNSKTQSVLNQYSDVVDLKTFDNSKLKLRVKSASENCTAKAIAYAWQ